MANPKAKKNTRKSENRGEDKKNVDRKGKRSESNSSKSNSTSVANALLQSAANISFPTTAGLPLYLNQDNEAFVHTGGVFRVPGVMRLGFVPTPGICKDWSSPFNAWVRDQYTFIRHANSGHSNYDASNLGMYYLSMDGCLLYLSWVRRLIGLTQTAVIPQNAYTPRDLVTAAGGDYEDLVCNLAQLRTYANLFASRLQALKVPNMHFFGSHNYLVENVFKDSDVAKSSFYVFSPDAVWSYHLGTTPEDTFMQASHLPRGTYENIVAFGEELLNGILNNEDFNIMSGDIMKAYTDYYTPLFTEVDYGVMPIVDPFILNQIHNANVFYHGQQDAVEEVENWRITEDYAESANAGALLFAPQFRFPYGEANQLTRQSMVYAAEKNLVDLPFDQPGAGDVALVSRFMVDATIKANSANNGMIVEILSHGSEIITSCEVTWKPGEQHIFTQLYLGDITQFDWHPYVPQFTIVVNGDNATEFAVSGGNFVGEVNNVTVMDRQTLGNIHYATMLDLFGLTAK